MVREIVGHSDIEVTMTIYAHTSLNETPGTRASWVTLTFPDELTSSRLPSNAPVGEIRGAVLAGQKWRSGAGSNRRPSAFQGLYRPLRPNHERFLLPCSSQSPLVSSYLDHFNRSAELCRRVTFRLWDSCGDRLRSVKLWGFCGELRANADAPASPALPCTRCDADRNGSR